MLTLNNLTSAGKKRKRIGRGGDRGGTSTRGHQGQGSRSGGSVGIIFEGGQMPLTRRLPKRGFNNADFKKIVEIVNLGQLENAFDANAVVDQQALVEKGLIRGRVGAQIKILANGSLTKALHVQTHALSASAAEKITQQGGEVTIIKER